MKTNTVVEPVVDALQLLGSLRHRIPLYSLSCLNPLCIIAVMSEVHTLNLNPFLLTGY
jgi:hypothetical protein